MSMLTLCTLSVGQQLGPFSSIIVCVLIAMDNASHSLPHGDVRQTIAIHGLLHLVEARHLCCCAAWMSEQLAGLNEQLAIVFSACSRVCVCIAYGSL